MVRGGKKKVLHVYQNTCHVQKLLPFVLQTYDGFLSFHLIKLSDYCPSTVVCPLPINVDSSVFPKMELSWETYDFGELIRCSERQRSFLSSCKPEMPSLQLAWGAVNQRADPMSRQSTVLQRRTHVLLMPTEGIFFINHRRILYAIIKMQSSMKSRSKSCKAYSLLPCLLTLKHLQLYNRACGSTNNVGKQPIWSWDKTGISCGK